MRRRFTFLVALALVAVSYFAARPPSVSRAELEAMASRFAFDQQVLPEPPNPPPHKSVRQVHPDLERISAWVSSVGAGVALADLDGDQLPNDIVQVDPRTDRVTVSPAPGTGSRYEPFYLETQFWSHNGYDPSTLAPTGSVVGDFNEDGNGDILVYFWGRTPVLYLRQPSSQPGLSPASFVPRELTPNPERWYTDCAVQADLDGDGHVDLLFGNYFQDGARILDPKATDTVVMNEGKAKALNGGQKHVFLWKESTDGASPTVRYEEAKDVFRTETAHGWTVALGAADLDGDLLPEIYFAHDFGPDRLLHNRSVPGRLEFAELTGRRNLTTPKSCVIGQDSFKGMGCDFADLNDDGYLDIYVSNIATRFGLTESHFVWLSTGRPEEMKEGIAPYLQASEKLGLSRSGFGWDARLADFDNDGVLEAIQACGFIKGRINRWPELQALGTSNDKIVHNPRFWPSFRPGADLSGGDWNPFFVRAADGRYHDISAKLGLAEPMVSRGLAIADVDGDGRLDFACANQWGESDLFRNNAPRPGSFLGLRLLRGRGSPAIGATATVTTSDGRRRVGYVDGGSGHTGRRSPDIHFGLGPAGSSVPLAVEVRWRDAHGQIRQLSRRLTAGWHQLNLDSAAGEIASSPSPTAP